METTIQLTTEQQQAVEHGDPVPVTVGQTECVVIRRDVYEKIQGVLYDDSEISDDEMRAIAARTLDDLDTSGPIQRRFPQGLFD